MPIASMIWLRPAQEKGRGFDSGASLCVGVQSTKYKVKKYNAELLKGYRATER